MSEQRIFDSKVDMRSRTEMIKFLTGHFRYDTMNSWNRCTAYANNVKLHKLQLPEEVSEKAWDFVCGDVDSDFDFIMGLLIEHFKTETGYDVGTNGRSGGYLVMYEAEKVPFEYQSFCPICGQRNYQKATANDCKCGKCGNDSRINYGGPNYTWKTFPGRSVGSDDPYYYEDFTMEQLKEEVKLVHKFDELCDEIRSEFIYMLRNGNIEDEEYTVIKKRKVMKMKEGAY